MPAFLVSLPEVSGLSLVGGANRFVVFAGSAADAKAAVSGFLGNDAIDAVVAAAVTTATEVVAGTDFSDHELRVAILDSTPVVDALVQADASIDSLGSAAVNAGGTGYSAGDVLTVAGGTATRAATFRVTTVSTGVITGVELADPGEYTVNPTLTANAVTGGGGSSATLDLTMAGANSYEAFLARMVTALNAQSIIAGAAVDFGSAGVGSTDLRFTIASGSGGDDLGDKDAVVEFRKNGSAVPGLIGTVTDGGLATAVLRFAIPAVAARVSPSVTALRT